MDNTKRISRQEVTKYIMNVVIVFLCVVTLIAAFMTAQEAYYYFGIPYDIERFESYILYEEYPAMVSAYHENMAEGFEGNAEMKEYYGVAEYYEAASYYKIYMELGDNVRAERERAKMDAAYEKMGGWNIVQQDIHGKLGLPQPDEM